MGPLANWYRLHGRHDLPWRRSTDRWEVLVSEIMLQQTQVSRVLTAWPEFSKRFPTPKAMAAVPLGEVIQAWGRLGYPRRARRLWESAVLIVEHGWPEDLSCLPGVGRYTALAVAAQVDDRDVEPVEVNIRRVVERMAGQRLTPRAAEQASRKLGRPLRGRDRFLALMDIGAVICRARDPRCAECPLRRRCATRGPLPDGERHSRQAPFEGSFRQARGRVLQQLRTGSVALDTLSSTPHSITVLGSLIADGLIVIDGPVARLP